MNYLSLLAISVLQFSFANAAMSSNTGKGRICVLPFLPKEYSVIVKLKQRHVNNPHVIWVDNPIPKDIFTSCYRSGPIDEIILLVHGLTLTDTGGEVLGYTRELSLSEKISYNQIHPHQPVELTKTFYQPEKPILDFPFRNVLEIEKTYLREHSLKRLRQITIVGCNAELISQKYPSLQELSSLLNVHLKFSPKAFLQSLIIGQTVSTPDIDWIEESFQFEDSQEHFYSYMVANDFAFYAWGEGNALRHQYSVTMQSLALGFSTPQWIRLYIPFSKVKHLKAGESTTFIVPRLNLDLTLGGLKVEASLSPDPHFLANVDLNALQLSLNIFALVKVTRNY